MLTCRASLYSVQLKFTLVLLHEADMNIPEGCPQRFMSGYVKSCLCRQVLVAIEHHGLVA